MSRREKIKQRVDSVRRDLLEALVAEQPLVVVKAPPGSGKTRLILDAAALLRNRGQRVAIAAQTNSQANDICGRLAREFPFDVTRFYSGNRAAQEDLGGAVAWVDDKAHLPPGECIVVGTTAKWGLVELPDSYDWLLIDEAWQMAEADFMLLREVAPRFVMVGDPGQIPPVVTIDTARWATAELPPHRPAPELILAAANVAVIELALPASRRLPYDSAKAVNTFYDFEFESWAGPGDRALTPGGTKGRDPVDDAIELLATGSMVALTAPTPPEGPPLEEDREVAELAARVVARLAERGGELRIDGETRSVAPDQIGLSATHRKMNSRMHEALPAAIARDVRVDTPERWQGLERPLMVVVHPVSGVTEPTAFDLETGRLCVMVSRHQVGLIVVTRDHLPLTLEELTPSAEQHVGLPDVVGQGHARHEDFWERLSSESRVLAL
jgi:AAA domain